MLSNISSGWGSSYLKHICLSATNQLLLLRLLMFNCLYTICFSMAVDDDWRMLPNNVMALLCIVASTGTVPDRAQTAASTVVTGMDSSNFNTFFIELLECIKMFPLRKYHFHSVYQSGMHVRLKQMYLAHYDRLQKDSSKWHQTVEGSSSLLDVFCNSC